MKRLTHIQQSSGRNRITLSLLMIVLALISTLQGYNQSAMPDVVCVGATKHYWVDPTPGSTYTWQINGVTQTSTTNEIYINWDTPYTPAGSPYTLSVQEMSATGCSGAVKSGLVYINPVLPVSITITPGQNPVCDGSAVTFSSNVINGGSNPAYAWHVNSGPVAGTGTSFSYIPANGDQVTCELTSNAVCITNNPAVCNPVTMHTSSTPHVVFTPCFDTMTMVNALPYLLKGGLPLGGSYSGSGVNTSIGRFDPATAGVGAVPVTYKYVNAAGCADSASAVIHNLAVTPFTCGQTLIDLRDNKSYPTIQIGSQCWMASNLDYGTSLSSVTVQADNCNSEKYCYDNNPSNCVTLGGLYQWDELMNYDNTPVSQGLCPPGWHVPTEAEWLTLFNFYGGNAQAGRPLQDLLNPGFHALPGGVLYQNNTWNFKDIATFFWSSTPTGPVKVMSHGMNIFDVSVSDYESLKSNAFPARCLHD